MRETVLYCGFPSFGHSGDRVAFLGRYAEG